MAPTCTLGGAGPDPEPHPRHPPQHPPAPLPDPLPEEEAIMVYTHIPFLGLLPYPGTKVISPLFCLAKPRPRP